MVGMHWLWVAGFAGFLVGAGVFYVLGYAQGTWVKRKRLRQQEFEEEVRFHHELIEAVRGVGKPPRSSASYD